MDAFEIGSKALALLFIFTSLVKTQDSDPFLTLMGKLGIEGGVARGALWFLIALEGFLAFVWWTGWQLRVLGLVTVTLFVTFAILLEVLWRKGHRESCGCYGGLAKVNPRQGLRLNMIYSAIALFVWSEIPVELNSFV